MQESTPAKKRAELFFEKSTTLVIRYRIVVILLTLLATAFFISQIRSLEIDTSTEAFFHDDDPVLLAYNDFRDQFGRDDKLVVAIRSDSIFTTDFLVKLKKLYEELEENVPHLSDITSMINVRNTRGDGDVLRVDDLLAHFPESEDELKKLKAHVMTNPLYRNQLISEDGTFTAIVLESEVYVSSGEVDLLGGFDDETTEIKGDGERPLYLSDDEVTKTVEAVMKIAKAYEAENFHTFVAGTPAITQTVKQYMIKDMKRFMRLAILTIGICLLVMFRRLSGVVTPLLVVGLTVVATLGTMSLTGTKFKITTTILPSFLLAVGVCATVHALALTYLGLRHGKTLKAALVAAYSHSGLAIVMTSLTTAAGLASFASSKVAPVADLGIYSAVGVLIALFYTFTFLPALLSLLPIKMKKSESVEKSNLMDRILAWISSFSVRRYREILAVAALLVAIGVAGLFKVNFSHDVLTWLPESLDVRKATEVINEEMRGSVVLEVVLDTGRENGLYDRQTLLALDRLTRDLEADYRNTEIFVGKAISLNTVLKEIHQALHENDPAFYKIPDNERLIPQELLLFENSGSDDLEDLIDSQFRKVRITLKVPWVDSLLYTSFIDDVEKRFRAEFDGKVLDGGEDMQLEVTGIMSLLGSTLNAAIHSATQSYIIALVVITILMIVLIGETRLGLLSMVPNLGPIFMILGGIGWFGVPLNMFTMMVASIAIGLSVDDTIHFMYNFKKYYSHSGNVLDAVQKTMGTAGRALLTTSVVLSIGFFIFMLASMSNLIEFGLFTALATILALASNFFVAPALLTLFITGNQKS